MLRGCLVLVSLAMLAGCNSAGGYGESVRFKTHDESRADEVLGTGSRLELPSGAKFSITQAQRRSEGAGRAESEVSEEGTARCLAAVDGHGSASAGFQLGHMIFNAEDKPREVTITLDCDFEYSSTNDPTSPAAPDLIGLKFYVKDSNRIVQRKESLIAPDGTLGAARHSGRQVSTFDVTLEPGLAYQLVLAGEVDIADADERPPLEASITVRKCSVTVADR